MNDPQSIERMLSYQHEAFKHKTVVEGFEQLIHQVNNQRKQIQELTELKDQFLGVAAHDLRSPASTIITFIETMNALGDKLTQEKKQYYLDRIQVIAEQMLGIVKDFLEISRIERGKFELDINPFSLSNLLEQAYEQGRFLAEKKNIHLIGDTLNKTVEWDFNRMLQVLNNLISNAIKFTHKEKSVFIRTEENSDNIIIKIIDQGVGMSKEDLSKLFVPFGRAGNKATGGERSTGLGLYICKMIVEAHKGTIGMDSEEGKGTVVSLNMPLHVKN